MKNIRSIITLVISSVLVGVVLFYIVKNLRKPKPQKSPVLIAVDSARYYKHKADSISLSLDSATQKYIQYETDRILANYRLFNKQRNSADSAIIETVRRDILERVRESFRGQYDSVRIHQTSLPGIADRYHPTGRTEQPPD